MGMVSIMDVARYILDKHAPMTPMRLQKLCYFAQVHALTKTKRPLFVEDFEAWKTGPVCPELYCALEGRSYVDISQIPDEMEKLSDGQKEIVDDVLQSYGGYDDWWLGQLSMMQEPWQRAQRARCTDHRPNVITKQSMAKYNRVSEFGG